MDGDDRPAARVTETTARIEALSDGVFAIIVTLMAFQLVPPDSGSLAALRDRSPEFAAFVLAFVYVGIYWNNHHHLLRVTERIDGRVMWANLHLLFWLTLSPLVAQWLGAHPTDPGPVAVFGVVACFAGLAYSVLVRAILRCNPGSRVVEAIGSDRKGNVSLVMYLLGVAMAFVVPAVSLLLYIAVAVMWFVPDRRLEGI